MDKHCSDYWPQKDYGVVCRQEVHYSFVSCYCIVVDDVNKQISFHGNAPPSCKKHPLIFTISAYAVLNIPYS